MFRRKLSAWRWVLGAAVIGLVLLGSTPAFVLQAHTPPQASEGAYPTVVDGDVQARLIMVGRVIVMEEPRHRWADERLNTSRERLLVVLHLTQLQGEPFSGRYAFGQAEVPHPVQATLHSYHITLRDGGFKEVEGVKVPDPAKRHLEILLPTYGDADLIDISYTLHHTETGGTLTFLFRDVPVP